MNRLFRERERKVNLILLPNNHLAFIIFRRIAIEVSYLLQPALRFA